MSETASHYANKGRVAICTLLTLQ